MNKLEIKYPLQNIPIPSKESYQLKLKDKTESLVKRMKQRTFYYLNRQKCDNNIRKTFDFKSRKYPPTYSDLVPFEKDLSSLKVNDVK